MANQILSPDYITPDNDIWLLKDIPLEQNYENTILWKQGVGIDGSTITGETIDQARARQFAWFTSTSGALHISSTTYQRENRKYVRVDKPIKDLMGYNYIVFKNTGAVTNNGVTVNKYENKYYYGFITNYEYLNDRVTLVHYAIDLLQTFNFDYTVTECFVEREHAERDYVGDNILEEPVSVGAVDYHLVQETDVLKDWSVGLLSSMTFTIDPNSGEYTWLPVGGHLSGKLYNGLAFIWDYNYNNINNVLMQATQDAKSDAIVSVFMIPTWVAMTHTFSNFNCYEGNWYIPKTTSWTYQYRKSSSSGIKRGPRNKKLYVYLFNKLYISNNAGDAYDYHYEFFNVAGKTLTFKMFGTVLANGEFMIAPNDYRYYDYCHAGSGTADDPVWRFTNFNESLSIKSFPQCSYSIDAYRAWLAQTKGQRTAQVVGATVEAVGTTVSGVLTAMTSANTSVAAGANATSGLSTMIGGATSYFREMANLLGKEYDMSRMPNTVKGQTTDSLSLALNLLNFYAYNVHVTPEFACQIDDFFDLYGYACKKVKTPNRDVRQNWCYCKTVGCRLRGFIPGDVDEAICAIYNNGIRFWKNPNNIGHYDTLTNTPIYGEEPEDNDLEILIGSDNYFCKYGYSVTINSNVYSGTGPYTYTWYKKYDGTNTWIEIQGETNSYLSYTPTMTDNLCKIKVTASDSTTLATGTSNETTLYVVAIDGAFYVTISPISVDVAVGETMTLTSTVVGGEAPYTYQWKYLQPASTTWTNVATNGTSANYSLVTAARHNGNEYKLAVTDANNNTVESNISVLTVS